MRIKVNSQNDLNLTEINVKSHLPASLSKLEEIANNIWWVWNADAKDLFRKLDPSAWIDAVSNPLQMLNNLSYERLTALGNDKEFIKKVEAVYENFSQYMSVPVNKDKPSVAYFSMEYGLTELLKIYSGGLGVLAGDYLKEASDCNVNLTAVGFLYRYGYFTQSLSVEGQQIAVYEPQVFENLPIKKLRTEDGKSMVVEIPYLDKILYAYVWKVSVGRISLYLLDTDNNHNSPEDRSITHQLYGGDWENRMKQEYLLGVGGIHVLNKLGIEKDVYHCNEGHAALINAQRLADLIQTKGLTFNQALEVVRGSSIYTVHTPVPAGHDSFEEGLFHKYMNSFSEKLGISWEQFIDMGRERPGDLSEKFSMSTFACNTCQQVNGVSWLHGKVSQKMFNPIWKGYYPEELHVNYVTNGVHLPTWTASEWKALYEKYFTKSFYGDQSNLKIWEAIYSVPDEEIWSTRMGLKNKLVTFIKNQFSDNWLKNQGDPSRIVNIIEAINPNALIIGFGRRFATYKRAHLLFTDLERLERIVNNPIHPVQFLFTGKAHPADGGGQGLIKRIIEISRMPQFLGKIIFLENYDMRLAKRLVSGVDIWLNTPTRPLEASGTSGEKAQMNGVLNFSVLDGWWLEGYVKGAGWALTEKRTYENDHYQDQLDAATIYSMLENEIIPLYYAKNTKGYSPEWIQVIKNSIALITPRYTMKRMLDDYYNKFYYKLASSHSQLIANNFEKAKAMAEWKEKVAAGWDDIKILNKEVSDDFVHTPKSGLSYNFKVEIDASSIQDNGVGLELVLTKTTKNNSDELFDTKEFEVASIENNKISFTLNYQLGMAGAFKFGLRMFPKNENLPHRQDFCYVRWI